MLATTVVCGIRLKKSFLGNMCFDNCSFCIWGKIAPTSKMIFKKCNFGGIIEDFLLKKHIFCTKTDCHCMNKCDEIVGPSQTNSIKRAMICEFILANPPNS